MRNIDDELKPDMIGGFRVALPGGGFADEDEVVDTHVFHLKKPRKRERETETELELLVCTTNEWCRSVSNKISNTDIVMSD